MPSTERYTRLSLHDDGDAADDESATTLMSHGDDDDWRKERTITKQRPARTAKLWICATSASGLLNTILLLVVLVLLVDRRQQNQKQDSGQQETTGDLTGFAPRCKHQLEIRSWHTFSTMVPDSLSAQSPNRSPPSSRIRRLFPKTLPSSSPTLSTKDGFPSYLVSSGIFLLLEALDSLSLLTYSITEGLGYLEVKRPERYNNLPTPLTQYPNRTVFTTSMTHQLHCLVSDVPTKIPFPSVKSMRSNNTHPSSTPYSKPTQYSRLTRARHLLKYGIWATASTTFDKVLCVAPMWPWRARRQHTQTGRLGATDGMLSTCVEITARCLTTSMRTGPTMRYGYEAI